MIIEIDGKKYNVIEVVRSSKSAELIKNFYERESMRKVHLCLTIEKSLRDKAGKFAAKNNRSLSGFISDLLIMAMKKGKK
jgi:hypothetical protein